MPDAGPPPDWLEAANRLATVARQLTTVVHETNNLLQIISGNAEMLTMSGELSEKGKRRADMIAVQARRASVRLGDVLAFAREPAIEPARVDLAAVAAEAVAMRKYATTRARIAVAFEPGEPVWTIANPRRTLQILLNLLMNAEEAVAGGDAPQVSIAVAGEGGESVVTVEDNGRGWTPGAEPGARPALEATAGSTRLGIGLRVAAWLAAEQGGRLTIEARPDGGTIAALRLPPG